MRCILASLGGCPASMLWVASQWATLTDLGISYQIVICLLFACDYLRYIVLHLCITQRPGEYRINCISLLILSTLVYWKHLDQQWNHLIWYYLLYLCPPFKLGYNNHMIFDLRRLWQGLMRSIRRCLACMRQMPSRQLLCSSMFYNIIHEILLENLLQYSNISVRSPPDNCYSNWSLNVLQFHSRYDGYCCSVPQDIFVAISFNMCFKWPPKNCCIYWF